MQIVYAEPPGPGWHPITHMVGVMAQACGADLAVVPGNRPWRRTELLEALLPRRRRGAEDLLVLCPTPSLMRFLLAAPRWRTGFRTAAAWVIDSWWDDAIPRLARARSQFDLVYVSEAENIDRWREVTGRPVRHLPVGTDVLGNPVDVRRDRPVDVLRVGRMPAAWDDDEAVGALARERGLRFAGRPPMSDETPEAMRLLWEAEHGSRFVVAFSNTVSPAANTHPTADYFTPRWADALGSGCRTAGRLPRTRTTAELVWPEANVELPHDDPARGLDVLAEHVGRWTPAEAARTRLAALGTLDWRHRFRRIGEDLSVDETSLARELERLEAHRAELVSTAAG